MAVQCVTCSGSLLFGYTVMIVTCIEEYAKLVRLVTHEERYPPQSKTQDGVGNSGLCAHYLEETTLT